MKYLIKQKLVSLTDGYTIKDEAGNDCFKIKGKVISLGKKLTLSDMQDRELCFIDQKLKTLMPKFNINVNSQTIMTIKQKFTFFTKKFNISGVKGEYKVEGNIIAKDFRVIKDGAVVVTISKKLLSVADTYSVEIADHEDQALMVAVAIVLDAVCH